MNRQSILERLGWRFIRIRGCEFFSNETLAMENVINKLNELEIYPEENQESSESDDVLKNKIILRAQEIRDEWYGEEENVM